MIIKWVNGYTIRNTTNTDFAGFATHEYDPQVKKGEVWIENTLKREKNHFLRLVKAEKNHMSVKQFAQLRKHLAKEAKQRGTPPPFVRSIERRGSLNIMFVDGAIVRQYIDAYFLLGGHHYVYPYIPKNEIWIDDLNYADDQEFTIIHELHERNLMKKGMRYESAHDYALAEERFWRRKKGVARFING